VVVVTTTMFVPGGYVPLTQAVVDAFAVTHSGAIDAAGLKPDQAKQIAAHWLARDKLRIMEGHAGERTRAARRGKRLSGVMPPRLAAEDLAMAHAPEGLRARAQDAVALGPLLEATWGDLRGRLSAGEVIGSLVEPASGKIHKIAAHEWNRDDAEIAHVTGWFSIPHAWGYFVGPVVLLRSDIEQMIRPNPIEPLPIFSSGRRGRKEEYDWEEVRILLTEALDQRGDFIETDQVPGWNRQAHAEELVKDHFNNRDQHPSTSRIRDHVRKIVEDWRNRNGRQLGR
jgi:hypothetical protein